MHYNHVIISYNKSLEVGGSKLRDSLCNPLHLSHMVSGCLPHLQSSPSSILHRVEREKQKGSLLLRCYLITFCREENLPVNPPANVPLHLPEVGHMPTPYHSTAEKDGIAVTGDEASHDSSQGSGKRPTFPAHCSMSHIRTYGSVTKEEAGRGGSGVAADEIGNLWCLPQWPVQ